MTLPHTTAAARLAAKLLAHRQTPHDEVPELIRNVHGALLRLGQQEETITEAEVTSLAEPQALAPRVRRPRQPRAAAPADTPEEAPSVAPAMPKLVRRAEVVAPSSPAPAGPLAP